MSEDRFVDIEMRLAHQDQLLHELDDVVTSQQTKIMQLDALCQSLIERLRSMADNAPSADVGDERPPHY
ncbi:MAG: SlyX family protein [Woeseiaceae bacterium]